MFSCQSFIGFLVLDIVNLIGLFIPLWPSNENSFKSSGSTFVALMISKRERNYIY